TRTYAARFTIENPDDTVALGMTATVTLSHGEAAEVAKLPLAAVLDRGTGPSVYLVGQSDALQLRPVAIPPLAASPALVTSGLGAGERVVALGVQTRAAGHRVRAILEH